MEKKRFKKDEPEYEVLVVPWRTSNEFKKVYEYLFSPEIIKKQWAVDQISVWEQKCDSLPSAIEASYGLTSAVIQDILWTKNVSVNQQIDIQFLYSSAITRFVNVTVDIHANKQGNMSTIAKGLGIPSYIIDLRNEASHSQRPSLSWLRIAANAALKYLKESYWDIEVKQVQNYIQEPIDVSGIEALLKKYVFNTFKVFQKQEISEVRQKRIIYLLKKLGKCIKKDKKSFIKVLVEDYFVPADDVFHEYLTDFEKKFFEPYVRRDRFAIAVNSFNEQRSMIPRIPAFHKKLWIPVIKLLNKNDAVTLFLETLLKTQDGRTVLGQKLIILWALSILGIHSTGRYLVEIEIKRIFKIRGCLIDWHTMLYAAVANPCKYTPFLLPLIFSNANMRKEAEQRISHLVAISLGLVIDESFQPYKSITGSPRIFTLDDLKRAKRLQEIEKQDDDSDCIWSLVTDDSYKNWPLGHVLNPVTEEENMQTREDPFDLHVKEDRIEERFISINENDEKDGEKDEKDGEKDEKDENISMDTEAPGSLEQRALEAIKKRKSFLYQKKY